MARGSQDAGSRNLASVFFDMYVETLGGIMLTYLA